MTAHPRVVSLVPSVTETLLAWGLTPAACTRFCEQPELLHVGGTKNPDVEAVVALSPDLVVVDREENRLEDHDALVDRGVEVLALHVASVDHVGPELERLAAAVGVAAPPLGALPPRQPAMRRTAFVPIWRRPWMTIGSATYGATVLAHLGVDVAFGDSGDAYPTIEETDLASSALDLVLAPTEPYAFTERHLPELGEIAPAMLIDGQDLFWWGVRTPAAIARLADQLAAVS